MKQLVKSEIRLWLSKKNLILIGAALLSIIFCYQSYEYQYREYDKEVIRLMENEVIITQNYVNEYQSEIDKLRNSSLDDPMIETLQLIKDIWEVDGKYASLMKTMLENNNDHSYDAEILILDQSMDENAKRFVEAGIEPDAQNIFRYSYQTLQNREELRKVYQKNNVVQKVNPYIPEGMYVLHAALSGEGSIIIILFVLLLLLNFNIWSYDFETQAYRLLFTQPYSKHKIYFTRCLINIIMNLMFLIGFFLILFMIASVQYGIGGSDFTYIQQEAVQMHLYAGKEGTALYRQITTILPLQVTILICYTICYLLCVQMISFFTRKSEISFMVSCVLLVLLISCIETEPIQIIGYFQTMTVLQGGFHITAICMILLMMILSMILYFIGWFALKYRDCL